MNKLCAMMVVVLLLAGCSNGGTNSKKTDNKVLAFTERAFALNEMNKTFSQELSKQTVEDYIFKMKDETHSLIAVSEEVGDIAEGLTDDAAGKKVNCYKLPVTFSFTGDEGLITDFLTSFEKLETKVVMNQFSVEETEEDYSVDCIVSFIGSSAKNGVGGFSNSLSLVKKNKEVKEEEEIVLRDFDVNLTVRPCNSDAAAVTVSTKDGNVLYHDENSEAEVKVEFYKEGNQNYCKYTVDDQTQIDKILVSDEIKFDILSCKKKLSTDEIFVDLTIQNNLSKSVSVMVYNDSDERIKVTKSGNVEVTRK